MKIMIEKMAKDVAEKALDEYGYEGKTIRQWVEILKDYDDKKSTLERIVERLEESKGTYIDEHGKELYQEDYFIDIDDAIEIVKEEGGLND